MNKLNKEGFELYINKTIEEVIKNNIKAISQFLDENENIIFYTSPEISKIITDRIEHKYRAKILASEIITETGRHYLSLEPESYIMVKDILDEVNPLICMSSYVDYLTDSQQSETFPDYVEKQFKEKALRAISDRCFQYENEVTLFYILCLVQLNEPENYYLKLQNFIAERKQTLKNNDLKKLGIESIKYIDSSFFKGYSSFIYFESNKNFYLLLLGEEKNEIHVSCKDSKPLVVNDIELSKDGFEIIDILSFEDTLSINPKKMLDEKRKEDLYESMTRESFIRHFKGEFYFFLLPIILIITMAMTEFSELITFATVFMTIEIIFGKQILILSTFNKHKIWTFFHMR